MNNLISTSWILYSFGQGDKRGDKCFSVLIAIWFLFDFTNLWKKIKLKSEDNIEVWRNK